jgi:membrane-associated phospholipid phosphatase
MDAALILESMVLAVDLNQLVKIGAGRERPFVHALPEAEKGMTEHPEDNNLSFYSGHTTFAFSLAVSAGTIASMRRYKLAPAVWAVGLTAATATGWLRIAADRHYFTDVLIGALAGGAVGFAVPWIHRTQPRSTTMVAPVPMRGGVGLAWTGTF